MSDCVYIFLDEGGNFDFSPRGTRYFTLTSVTGRPPFPLHQALDALKHRHLEQGRPLLAFHCTEDNKHTRNEVFTCIAAHLASLRIDSVVIDKTKVKPEMRDPVRFYPRMVGHLLRYVMNGAPAQHADRVVIITDGLPSSPGKNRMEKAIKQGLAERLAPGATYSLLHHPSCSHFGLQVADYCNWAVFRKWQKGETYYYDLLKPNLRSELDVYRLVSRRWY